ncbi:MAG: biotin--[acetyl-CoA-carboxylase] ligase [Lachnospiraceae bacterium]
MRSKILSALKACNGFVSGQELCEQLGVSRTAVWKEIKKLQTKGYQIEAVSNRGYRLLHVPDILSREEILSSVKAEWTAKEVYYVESIDSTNTRAKQLAESGSGHGTLIVAEEQLFGRGRRGREWKSEKGSGIYMTLLLKPDFSPHSAGMITLVTAMAVVKSLQSDFEIPALIKWPNDIVLNGKKICGILTELSAEIDYINYLVIGIGINVSNDNFPDELTSATSILSETGITIRRADLIASILSHFERYYSSFLLTMDLTGIYKEYNHYLANRDQKVVVHDPQESYEGLAKGVTSRGELIVDTWESRRLVTAGEVSIRGIYGYL